MDIDAKSWDETIVGELSEREYAIKQIIDFKLHPTVFIDDLNAIYGNERTHDELRRMLNRNKIYLSKEALRRPEDIMSEIWEPGGVQEDVPIQGKKPKILLWDIESSNLVADFGFLLCIGYKWYGQKPIYVIRADQYKPWEKDRTDDSAVVREFIKVLGQADVQVTWYGAKFDYPFVQSRALVHRFKGELPPIPHIDLWRTARYKLKLSSNRLISVQRFLELPHEKSPVSGRIWVRAYAGHKESMKYIVEHCKDDVQVLEEAYDVLRPIVSGHPNLNLIADTMMLCPKCGSEHIIKQGYRIKRSRKWQRYQCQNCGGWCERPLRGKQIVR